MPKKIEISTEISIGILPELVKTGVATIRSPLDTAYVPFMFPNVKR